MAVLSDVAQLAPFVVRVAGLPARDLERLRFTDTSATVERLAAAQTRHATEGQQLSAALYAVIGAAADADLKPRLVGLRRALHQGRPPDSGEWNAKIQAGLPPDLRERVRRWLEGLQQWRRERARLDQVFVDEAVRKQTVLRELAADPGFRRALCQSSPSLTQELDKWLAEPMRRPSRQVLFRLARYVARAATKTSPYSAFTVSGLGEWSANGQAVRLATGWEAQGVLELPGRLRDMVAAKIVALPEIWRSLPVRVNPSATARAGKLSFLGRPPAEPVVTVPVTPTLRYCLDLLTVEQPMTIGTLHDRLAAANGASGGSSPHQFVRHLVDIGLLDVALPPDRPDPPLSQLADLAEGQDLADVAAALRRIEVELSRPIPVTDNGTYQSAQRSLRQAVDDLAARFDGLKGWSNGSRPVALDLAVAVGSLAECGRAAWRPALDDLASVLRWLAVFDSTLPLKLALAELWSSQFRADGRVPFLDFHRAVQEAAQAPDSRGEELRRLLSSPPWALLDVGESEFARVRELAQVRKRALQPVRAATTSDGTVDLAAAGELPSWISPPASLSCYVQPLWSAGELRLVLNAVDCGYGRGRSRVAHLVSRAGGEPPAESGRWTGDGARSPALAELGGAHGSTLNDRMPSVPHEIDYPFTTSRRATHERLPLNDLIVEYDPDRDLLRLRSARLRTVVKALDLGMLARWLLPPAAQLLVNAFGETSMIAIGHLLAPSYLTAHPANRVVGGTIGRVPRLTAGRVVLRRACWIVNAAAVPAREPGESDPGYLLRLAAWRRANGIPSRCFIRAKPSTATVTSLDEAGFFKWRKPVYLDFHNWFLVLSLENLLRSSPAAVVFEEALPDPEAVTEPADAPRVTEFIVEVSAGAGADA